MEVREERVRKRSVVMEVKMMQRMGIVVMEWWWRWG